MASPRNLRRSLAGLAKKFEEVKGDLYPMRKFFLSQKFLKAIFHAFWFTAGLGSARALIEIMGGLSNEGERAVILIALVVALLALVLGGK